MISCTRRIQFCAGHRVLRHESKCANMHGHNYVAFITCSASLDTVGRVIDFSCIKEIMAGWIDENWDHGFIYNEEDCEVQNALAMIKEITGGQKRFQLPLNPTAEVMAGYLFHLANHLLPVQCDKVRLYETENCYADYSALMSDTALLFEGLAEQDRIIAAAAADEAERLSMGNDS